MLSFPKDFYWGSATSSYQVEGNNKNCDWWAWEQKGGTKEKSGFACRHYDLFRQDFDLAKQLNHNAHRLSIEWSRIEPREGEFSQAEIDHYVEVINALRERGIEPVVTLHHFTSPIWFSKLGGWKNKRSPEYFSRYTKKITEALCDKVRFWVTINEPMIYAYHCFYLGTWPPQEKSFPSVLKATDSLIASHIEAYRAVHDIYKERNLPSPSVSVAKHLQAFEAYSSSLINKAAAAARRWFFNRRWIDRLIRAKSLDFLGINYYSHNVADVKKWGLKHFLLDTTDKISPPLDKNYLGWDIYPQGLFNLLLNMKSYNLPIFILENGICTLDDTQRWDFIREHLRSVHHAIARGVKVLGYLYWSLIDNYEWHDGFGPRFGIIEVDYKTYKRTVRESAKKFAAVCKTGTL